MSEAITPDLIISSPYLVSTLKSAVPPRHRPTVWDVIFVIMRLIMLEMVAFFRPRLSLSQILVALVVSGVTAGVIAAEGITWFDRRFFDLLVIVFDPLLKGVLC